MSRRFSLLVALLAVFSMTLSGSVGAQQSNGDGSSRAALSGDVERLDRRDAAARGWKGPLAARTGTVKAVIQLADPAATEVYAAARQTMSLNAAANRMQQQVARINAAQQRLLPALQQMNARVIYRVQRVYNGIAVSVDASKLDALANLPGVVSITPLVSKYRMHTASVPLIGAPTVWSGVSGVTGEGMSIGIIDSGIDYLHTMFGGPGIYPSTITDTTSLPNLSPYFPSAKVVGGYDFVGDAYDGSNTPKPDANPIDCLDPNAGTVGHGTHVAGSAAGYGVLSTGATFTGPWDDTIYSNNFRIGPGVAPEADLYALRVFGCDGSTDVTDLAIEWAVDPNGDGNPADHLDVINMSLGSDYGSNYDATSIASDNAALAGVIVVASAGNSDDTHFITGSPGSADRVISVAASGQSDAVVDAIKVAIAPASAVNRPASFSVAYAWDTSADVTGTLYYPATNRTACSDYSSGEAANIAGKVVLIDWSDGECGSVTRTGKVVAAGGIGAIIVDNSAIFDLFITGSSVIPSVSAPKTLGDELKTNIAAPITITFDGSLRNTGLIQDTSANDTVASFTSRGPSRSGVLKPDVAAPGVSIFSAGFTTGNNGQTLSGTSMAAPHVAGMMALLREIHPTWTVQELKALVMNSSINDVRISGPSDSQILGPSRIGTGRVNVPNAASLNVLAYDTAEPETVSVSFGDVEVVSSTSLTRTVTFENKGATAETFNLAYSPVTTVPGVSYVVSPGSVTVAAGATATATVVMSADPAQMQHVIDPTMSTTQAGFPRFYISEASGYLVAYKDVGVAAPVGTPFTANIRGYYENPPNGSATYANAEIYLDGSTLYYTITFNQAITLTGAHIHRGAAGTNGPVAYDLSTIGSVISITGNTTLSSGDIALLKSGGLYLNFHTAAYPGGQLRGQIVPAEPFMRLSVYSAPRPASDMAATLDLSILPNSSGVQTGTIALDGIGLPVSTNLPTDTISIATAFELAYTSSRATATDVLTDATDIQYVGINSDLAATEAVSDSTVLFAVTTYGEWASFNEVYIQIDIDTNKDGNIDYSLFTTNGGTTDANDDVFTSLAVLNSSGNVVDFIPQYSLNILPPDVADTQPYDTNVIVLGVAASDLGLTDADADFNYQVLMDTNVDDFGILDTTPVLTYDVANPSVSFANGAFDLPAYLDVDGTTIDISYNPLNGVSNGARGILILHHHNVSSEKVDVFGISSVVLPIVVVP
ncbi:MAG: hypothetical protein OHK0050_06710 [Roseiflexaceae bacterium]